MLKFVNITGKKEQKGATGEVILTTPTAGDFRMSPLLANKLGIKDGDNIVTVIHPEDATRLFIVKGITGENELDENGKPLVDARGREVIKENTSFGAIVRQSSSTLKFSATEAWKVAGGNNEESRFYDLAEPFAGEMETTLTDENGDAIVLQGDFYELIYKSAKPKSARGAASTATEGVLGEEEENDAFEGYEEEEA